MSLKWRIALGYSVLLIVALTAMSGLLVWRFQQILDDQAETTVNATMRTIVQFAQQSATPFSLEDSSLGTLQFLFNSSNLATWNSANSFVQVDSSEGYPLAKTENLGALAIPPNPNLSPGRDVLFRHLTLGGRSFLVEDRYLLEGANAAIIHVAEPLDTLQRTFARAREAIVIVLGTTAAAVIILSIVLAAQATTPINELSREMREISSDRLAVAAGAGAFDNAPPLQGQRRRDEIGRLAQSFNDLLSRLGEAFARERQFISDASHELKTPLTSINSNAQMLLRWGERDQTILRESLETIVRESADLAAMVNGMLTLAKADRGDEIPKEPLSLAQIATEVTQNAAPRAAEKEIEIHFNHTSTPTVCGDPNLLRQMIANLVDNAIKFTERGRVEVRVGSAGALAWVEVADSGPGVPPEELSNLFQRFYRADKARSREVPGTGLGLAIVRSIARVHGGEATAARSPAGGAIFRVDLPLMELPFTGNFMMEGRRPRYNGTVYGGFRRGALVALLASLCCLAFAQPVRADQQIDVGPSPILNVHLTHGKVTISTWDRLQVQISSTEPVNVRHIAPADVDPRIPKQLQISWQRIQTEYGPVALPAESFVLPELPGEHDAVVARGNGTMTIMIPRNTAIVIAHVRAGHLTLDNYHGVFVAHVRSGGISLDRIGGTGFVESMRGRIAATNSTFDRLRVRTATGNIFFQGCTSHQIQASSVYGSIVYDNGQFQPGLARFDSEHGNVALGVRGGAQIGAYSGSGHVLSSFPNDTQIRGNPNTQQATVGGGGPIVTATSKNGSVYLYSGSMNDHPSVRQELSGSTQLPVRAPRPPRGRRHRSFRNL